MAKFTLIIWVCSFLATGPTCLPPVKVEKVYNSWYECSRGAHKESALILSKLGYKYVNENQIATKYGCQELPPTI